jgi:hypothetical protein
MDVRDTGSEGVDWIHLNELYFWTISIVWCLKKIEELKIYTKYHNTHVHKIHTNSSIF